MSSRGCSHKPADPGLFSYHFGKEALGTGSRPEILRRELGNKGAAD